MVKKQKGIGKWSSACLISSEAGAESNMLTYMEAMKNDLRLDCGSTSVVRLAAVPDGVGHQVPEGRE